MPHLILSVGIAEPPITRRTVNGCWIITWLIAGGHALAQMLHIRGLRPFVYHGAPRVTILCARRIAGRVSAVPPHDQLVRMDGPARFLLPVKFLQLVEQLGNTNASFSHGGAGILFASPTAAPRQKCGRKPEMWPNHLSGNATQSGVKPGSFDCGTRFTQQNMPDGWRHFLTHDFPKNALDGSFARWTRHTTLTGRHENHTPEGYKTPNINRD
jgi:hypothetical protein